MKAYRVEGGVARIGTGEVVGLDEEQYRTRKHRVEDMDTKGAVKIVRLKEPLEFKVGETIQLPGDPPRNIAALVVPASAPRSAKAQRPRAKTGAEKKAAAAARKSKVAAAASATTQTGHTQAPSGAGGSTGKTAG